MTPPNDATIYQTPILDCWMGNDGILYSKSKNVERNRENYDKLFEIYSLLSDGGNNKLCTLGDITDTRPLERDVREYVAKETSKYIKAMALVSRSMLGKTVGSQFEVLSTTPYPIAVFGEEQEAIRWIREEKSRSIAS